MFGGIRTKTRAKYYKVPIKSVELQTGEKIQ